MRFPPWPRWRYDVHRDFSHNGYGSRCDDDDDDDCSCCFFDPSRFGTIASWVVALTGQRKTLLSCAGGSRKAENHTECVNEAQAAAPWCSRPVPSAEAAANEPGSGRDRNGRDWDAEADSERAPSAKLTGNVVFNAVARPTRRPPSAVLQARPCTEIDG